jgi:predicted lipid-binding transport protein (Tim44 family)
VKIWFIPHNSLSLLEELLPMHISAVHPSSPNSSQSEDDAATKIQAQWKGYRVRKQLRNSRRNKIESKMNGNSGEKLSIEEKSATKIQASWKGFKTRKDIQSYKIAATKIQAGWKGFKTRKELKNKKGTDKSKSE